MNNRCRVLQRLSLYTDRHRPSIHCTSKQIICAAPSLLHQKQLYNLSQPSHLTLQPKVPRRRNDVYQTTERSYRISRQEGIMSRLTLGITLHSGSGGTCFEQTSGRRVEEGRRNLGTSKPESTQALCAYRDGTCGSACGLDAGG